MESVTPYHSSNSWASNDSAPLLRLPPRAIFPRLPNGSLPLEEFPLNLGACRQTRRVQVGITQFSNAEGRGDDFSLRRRAAWVRMCYLRNMKSPSKIEATGGPEDTSKQQSEADSIIWKRDYKGCMITIFGSPGAGWNVKIDKREPIILGYTRPRAIKYAKELIDEEQSKFHSRSAGGLPRNSKVSPASARHSFPTVTSADRRRG